MTTKANDVQVGGAHYASELQHWDFAIAHFGTAYLKGQVTKYLYRWRKKGGVQDLEKAAHFLRKLIEATDEPVKAGNLCAAFIEANNIPAEEAAIIRIVTLGGESLKHAEALLNDLIAAEASSSYTDQDKP